VGNAIRLTITGDDSEIQAMYMYLLPTGDFDVQVDLTGYTVNEGWGASKDIRCSLIVTDYHLQNAIRLFYQYDHNGSDDMHMYEKEDGSPWDYINYGSVGSLTDCKLRIKRVGTVFTAYYTVSAAGNTWVLLDHYDHPNAALIDRVVVGLEEYGNDGTVDFDNLKFNKAECPSGDQWSTTTTSTSTLTSTTTTEPPV